MGRHPLGADGLSPRAPFLPHAHLHPSCPVMSGKQPIQRRRRHSDVVDPKQAVDLATAQTYSENVFLFVPNLIGRFSWGFMSSSAPRLLFPPPLPPRLLAGSPGCCRAAFHELPSEVLHARVLHLLSVGCRGRPGGAGAGPNLKIRCRLGYGHRQVRCRLPRRAGRVARLTEGTLNAQMHHVVSPMLSGLRVPRLRPLLPVPDRSGLREPLYAHVQVARPSCLISVHRP